MPCTGDRNLKFKVYSLMKKELHYLVVGFVVSARNVCVTIGTISLSGYGLCEEV
jgi:hypothetical protein